MLLHLIPSLISLQSAEEEGLGEVYWRGRSSVFTGLNPMDGRRLSDHTCSGVGEGLRERHHGRENLQARYSRCFLF